MCMHLYLYPFICTEQLPCETRSSDLHKSFTGDVRLHKDKDTIVKFLNSPYLNLHVEIL